MRRHDSCGVDVAQDGWSIAEGCTRRRSPLEQEFARHRRQLRDSGVVPPFIPHTPTWQRWLANARKKWRDVPDASEMEHLNFREELHAIDAVIAGQGIGICSDVLVARELETGALVRALDLTLGEAGNGGEGGEVGGGNPLCHLLPASGGPLTKLVRYLVWIRFR